MDEDTKVLNDLLGISTPVKEADKAEAPADEVEETEDISTDEDETADDDPEETETEESEDDEAEEEPQQPQERKKGDPSKALKFERDGRRADREAYQASIAEYEKLLSDPDFLKFRFAELQTPQAEGQAAPKVQAEIPTAPYYPNTPSGKSRMVADQIQATTKLGDLAVNPAVLNAIEGNVLKGKSYLEAAEDVLSLTGIKAKEFEKKGAESAKEAEAKKRKMSTEGRPRAGAASRSQMLNKRMQSDDRKTRERAIAESLGFI